MWFAGLANDSSARLNRQDSMKKKILVLGGKPIGSIELVERAKEKGLQVIVADFLPAEQSPAKKLADEAWDISTAEVDQLAERCRQSGVDGILTAVHEFNINRMLDLCERLSQPCYCHRDTWRYCDDKLDFKALCMKYEIPVAQRYDITPESWSHLQPLPYPVIVKPVDGSGSRGFAICHNEHELRSGYERALQYSPGKRVLVEDYIPYNAVIIHYTMTGGVCHYSGMSDKYSARFASSGASVMGLQTFPSSGEAAYLRDLDKRARAMFEGAGFTDGPIWIEAFYDGRERFIFNEMGYRLGGSLTHYPVRYFYGVDQLDLMIDKAMGLGDGQPVFERKEQEAKYCILPVHLRSGTITAIEGEAAIRARQDVYAYVPVHYLGDVIEEWGSAQQVFCYLHILYQDIPGLKASVRSILEELRACDGDGGNMLYTLFDFEKL